MNVLIVGAGRLGLTLANRLADKNSVTLVSRSQKACDSKITQLIKNANDLLPCDFQDSFDVVFVILSPDGRTVDNYYNTYAKTAYPICQSVLNNPHQKSTPHLFYISSTRVFGQDHGQKVSDSTIPNPQDEFADILYAAELIYRAFFQSHCTIIRPTGLLNTCINDTDDLIHSDWLKNKAIECQKIEHCHYLNLIDRDLVIDKLIKILDSDIKKPVYLFNQICIIRHNLYNMIRKNLNLPPIDVLDDLPITGKQVIDSDI